MRDAAEITEEVAAPDEPAGFEFEAVHDPGATHGEDTVPMYDGRRPRTVTAHGRAAILGPFEQQPGLWGGVAPSVEPGRDIEAGDVFVIADLLLGQGMAACDGEAGPPLADGAAPEKRGGWAVQSVLNEGRSHIPSRSGPRKSTTSATAPDGSALAAGAGVREGLTGGVVDPPRLSQAQANTGKDEPELDPS